MLELQNITKSYKTKSYVQTALNKVSIKFRKNEFASILGASGSGKTTMLNIIGGLDQYDSGNLLIEGISTKEYKSSNWDAYRNNRVGFVFQSFNLISHQTILKNVELALTLSGISPNERKKRAIEALDDVGLIDHIHKLPNQISGGQMQRVAIARALINDPEIVLADEPTGSLDSKTSSQVMDLLEKIAKDRLVIMVTHNPKLANKYANRIIELKDGEIIGDSNPYIDETVFESKIKETPKKSKMSFLTAVSLSVSNLLTKKGRTITTAIAGSIGIIGIAAILALASGINMYIGDVERDTMSAFPLSVDSSGINITNFLGGEGQEEFSSNRQDAKDDEINVINTVTALFSQQNKNDLKSFKEYIDNNEDKITPYVKNIQYKYGITPEIYLQNEKSGLRQVNPDTIFSKYGFDNAAGIDMISGAGSFGMKNFSELPGDTSLFEEQYDVVAGRWPSDKSELVVVLMDSGSLTDTTMYSLGIKDRNILKNIFEEFTSNESVDIKDGKNEILDYNEVLDASFKLVNSAEKFAYDESYKVWIDKSDDVKYMDRVIKEGLDLDVVGLIKAKPEVKTPMLSTGIYYPNQLTSHLIEEASSYDIVKEQLNDENINVFTNKPFDDETELAPDELFQLEDFITIDETKIEQSFYFDTSAINLDFTDFDINIDNIEFPELDLETLATSIAGQIDVPVEEVLSVVESAFNNALDDFEYMPANPDATEEEIEQNFIFNLNKFVQDSKFQEELIQGFERINDDTRITNKLSEIVQNYFSSYVTVAFDQIMQSVQNDFMNQIESRLAYLPSQIQNAVSIDTNQLAEAFEFNIDEDELFGLISSFGERDQVSQNSNLKTLGYRDIKDPTQIDLYPKDFTTKENVVTFIDNYNETMRDTNQEEKVVNYTDLIAAILSSVTTIINTITYALVAFVAISLVVSSIMIGVITYVSVLERIKEIGILRAIGASKKDIRRVFNAETLIIGFIAGSFGIFITYIISYFANIFVYNKFGIANIAHLEVKAAAILIFISMVLAFVSGLIPSSSAANKDPVEALRSE